MKTKLTLLLFLMIPALAFAREGVSATPAEAVEFIKKNINIAWADETADAFKAGNQNTPLKGIAECMDACMATLHKTVEADQSNFSTY